MKKRSEEKSPIDRRAFIKLLPSAGAALAAPAGDALAGSTVTNEVQTGPTEGRVTREMVSAAEKLNGLTLTEAEQTMTLNGLNRNLTSYETLRRIAVPLDTELATLFHPALPGKKFARVRTPLRRTKTLAPEYDKVEDLAFCTVTQLAELIRTRRVTSLELTEMYLSRLKKHGERLLCVVTLTEELARRQAVEADREIASGLYRGPLHGIPCGVKDLFATKGVPTTWGAEPYREQLIDEDATVIERLRSAGAVLVAKLSMGALAQGGRWFRGMTRNPWQPDETTIGSSGSSAGSAAATAAGLVGFAIGTETLGSIVSPSARCGVTGLRPTYGRISRFGAMALSWTMDKIGPICRGVEDCAIVLHALYGPDGRDLTVGEAAFKWNPLRPLGRLRIGYLKNEFDQGDEKRKGLYHSALDTLRQAGANLLPLELPKFETQSLRIILSAEAAAAFDDITRDGRIGQLSGQGPGDWPNTFRTSRFIPAVEYLRAQRARRLLMIEMDRLMRQWDVFVSPAPGSASLLITNLTGHPAVVTPCGFIDNLPQSIMFTGKIYDEGSPLRVALAYQQATTWSTLRPQF
ncbi:MAG: amidase [Acidobacteria bacterium]|nr:amidase [Acidobacteriota bacterium]